MQTGEGSANRSGPPPETIVSWCERQWGPLEADERNEFLQSADLLALTQFSDWNVQSSIRLASTLADAVRLAMSFEAGSAQAPSPRPSASSKSSSRAPIATGNPQDRCPTPGQILAWWEHRWGPLPKHIQLKFIRKAEVVELTTLPTWIVEDSLATYEKLGDALLCARALQNGRRPSTTLQGDSRASKVRPSYNRSEEPTSSSAGSTTSRGPSSSWAPDSIPGGQSSYHSGTVRVAGAGEIAIGEKCSACDAWVASGVSHDCCK